MDRRQFKIFPGLVIFLWTAETLSANQIVENGLADEKSLASYFFYQRPEYPRDCQEVQDYCSSTNTSGLYLIKPVGYPEPFEVYCENSQNTGGWTEGGVYANSDCTRLATCRNGQLRWDDSYVCSDDEVCEVRNSVRQCYCKPGSVRGGADCFDATDCSELYNAGFTESGVYNIKPTSWLGEPFEVYCNMSDRGGWTVFQRRIDSAVDFYQNWTSYREGFGSADHEMWLGNEKLYHLTKQKRYTIRIDLVNREGSPYYAKFDDFRIGNEDDKYRLIQLGTYTGTADYRSTPDGQALHYHLNKPFSTYHQDNDDDSRNCAEVHHVWWYGSCYNSNLNSDYHASWNSPQRIYWKYLPRGPHNTLFTEMKLRPLQGL